MAEQHIRNPVFNSLLGTLNTLKLFQINLHGFLWIQKATILHYYITFGEIVFL